ncbi:hypothetical protein RIF29_36628 [Crotalaria pallida]|uniref:Transmembrane protein n=1 Tax=Crotalaria pallida TaxID=3830 RepID=A0AAN9HYN8_CROPI
MHIPKTPTSLLQSRTLFSLVTAVFSLVHRRVLSRHYRALSSHPYAFSLPSRPRFLSPVTVVLSLRSTLRLLSLPSQPRFLSFPLSSLSLLSPLFSLPSVTATLSLPVSASLVRFFSNSCNTFAGTRKQ